MDPTCVFAAWTCSTALPSLISSLTSPAFPQKNCGVVGSPKLKPEKNKASRPFVIHERRPALVNKPQPSLFNLRAVGRQRLPASTLLFSCHAANDSSSTMLPFNHCVIAFLETRKADISDHLRLQIANVALGVLIVCRILGIFEKLRFRNPCAKACALDVGIGQVRFEPLAIVRGLRFVAFLYKLVE